MACGVTYEQLTVLHDASREARDRSVRMRQRSRDACERARRLLDRNRLLRTRLTW
jgi:hypothetical protein